MLHILLTLEIASCLELPSFYHKTENLVDIVSSLNCANIALVSERPLQTFKYSSQSQFKTMIIFGEHPRELISTELGLAYIRHLCETNLNLSDFLIVLNANPNRRQKVEGGEWCLRTNDNGVDINRNWAAHWKSADCQIEKDTCPGPSPFSETETQEMRDLMVGYKPDLMISIHSGTEAIFLPHVYSKKSADIPELERIVTELRDDFCEDCAIGNSYDILDYLAYGTCVDYAYDEARVPYSLAFEIYQMKNKHASFLSGVKPTCLMQSESSSAADCLNYFNPVTESEYKETIDRWIAILDQLVTSVSLLVES